MMAMRDARMIIAALCAPRFISAHAAALFFPFTGHIYLADDHQKAFLK